MKEPARLCFYPYAAYEITFNCGSDFSQGQIALLAKMPTLEEIENWNQKSITEIIEEINEELKLLK